MLPHEPLLPLEGLSRQKEIVRVFYKDMWDHADKTLIPSIFHHDFTFRGSLGPVLRGHAQFADYVDMVTQALGQYTTDILDLVEESNKVFGKVRFTGSIGKSCSALRRLACMSGGMASRCSPSRIARCETSGCLVTFTDCWLGCNRPVTGFAAACDDSIRVE